MESIFLSQEVFILKQVQTVGKNRSIMKEKWVISKCFLKNWRDKQGLELNTMKSLVHLPSGWHWTLCCWNRIWKRPTPSSHQPLWDTWYFLTFPPSHPPSLPPSFFLLFPTPFLLFSQSFFYSPEYLNSLLCQDSSKRAIKRHFQCKKDFFLELVSATYSIFSSHLLFLVTTLWGTTGNSLCCSPWEFPLSSSTKVSLAPKCFQIFVHILITRYSSSTCNGSLSTSDTW